MSNYRIIPSSNISGDIYIPGSKSYTNRALIIASIIEGEVSIKNPLFSDDTKVMVNCLKDLGIKITEDPNEIKVLGSIMDIEDKTYKLNTGLSGTSIRFLLALSCIVPGIKTIYGDDSLNSRPIGELAGALKDLGADIEYSQKPGYPPLIVKSSKLTKNETILHGDISSQFFSALLMIAPVINGLDIEVMGNQISKPYINMTIDLMKYFGVTVINQNFKNYIVGDDQKYEKKDYTVEGDYSSAGYFLAIAALTKSKLVLKNLKEDSIQADKNFIEIIKNMGSDIKYSEQGLTIKGSGVKPLNVDMENCPDQVQTLTVLLAFAKGKSTITGVRSLRIKETERVLALQNELSKMGIKTESAFDSLTIFGGNPKPSQINTYNDHRMAMSFAVAGALLDGMIIENPQVVNKTFPDFWDKLKEIGVKLDAV